MDEKIFGAPPKTPPPPADDSQEKASDDLLGEVEALIEALPSIPAKKTLLAEFMTWPENPTRQAMERFRDKVKMIGHRRRLLDQEPFRNFTTTSEGRTEGRGVFKREEILSLIQEVMSQPANMIGSGGTAEVYISQRHPQYCYKIITDVEAYRQVNDVRIEDDLLFSLRNLEVAGVRVPQSFYSFRDKAAHVLIMERLKAVTLSEVLEGVKALPSSFDLEDFFASLRLFVEAMHERGVHHRDLSAANIMIDLETGKPRVIDFGKSVKVLSGSEDPYLIKDQLTRVVKKYKDDLEQIQLRYHEMRRFLAGQKG
jgi:tRNA A-37 threonylcarbamoyl transferase component Bud32